MTGQRVKALVLKEAYRKVRVKEGDDIVALPAIQAILRGQIALAAKGNGPAQRAIIEQLRIIEQEMATDETARTNHQVDRSQYSELDVARRIAFALELGRRKLEQDKRAASETVKQIPDRKDAKR